MMVNPSAKSFWMPAFLIGVAASCAEDGGNEPAFTSISSGIAKVSSSSIAWGDFDRDGDLDIALAGYDGTDRIARIYRNDFGAFNSIGAGLTGVNSCCLAWGDYDNDGDLDLALAGGWIEWESYQYTRIYRNAGGTFTDTNANMVDVLYSCLAWGDYDNDGDLDLVLEGDDGTDLVTKLYRNDSGTFNDISTGLAQVYYGGLAWGDYDNDGDLDLALTGYGYDVSEDYISRIYRNEGSTFADTYAPLPGVMYSSLAWGDYDNDGDLDLALTGFGGSALGNVCSIYRNSSGSFADINAGLTQVYGGSLAWGDYDNDGDLDLVVAGAIYSDPTSKFYRNDAGQFTEIDAGLVDARGSLAWGDYDNDGDLDLALVGFDGDSYVGEIYRNNVSIPNNAPTAPESLLASVSGNGPYDVTFSWSFAGDGETPAEALTYNLRVGTTPGGDEVFSGMADAATGFRRIPARGAAQPGSSANEWTLALPAGTYYWSVQAIDTAFAGSPWAPEETVTVP